MSFRIAVSGLRAATTDLDVVSNNIANSNTTGFKRSRSEFADLFSVSNLGNSSNIPGSGVRVSDISQQFTQGSIAFTENNLDLAISGDGFFIVDDAGSQAYTRNGAFGVDRDGFVANSQGQRLQAFAADANGNISASASALQIDSSNIPPQATSQVQLNLNLDASESVPTVTPFDVNDPLSFNRTTSTTIFDSLGNSHTAEFYYVRTATANQWQTFSFVDGVQIDGPDTLTFNNAGILQAPTSITSPSFTPSGGGAAQTLNLNYANSTQFGAAFSVNNLTQDGFTTGRFSDLEIDADGNIFTRFTNGQSRVEGQIALANFPNPQGLQPVGDTAFGETFVSGSPVIGQPGTSTLGLIQAGALEDSNVDLSEELVDMIIAQRSFQANAEVIQTADSITQTVINIR